RGNAFQALAASIVYQQLSGKVARVIHARFVEALEGVVSPERVLEVGDEALRAAGLSANKIAATRDLAAKAASGELGLDELGSLPDEEVVRRLVRVRGVGEWTAQMYLLFELKRPDVWPTNDLGVRNGIARV